MKINVKPDESLVPFSRLKVGQLFITEGAKLNVVNTMYVKTGKTSYANIEDNYVNNLAGNDNVRPVRIVEATVIFGQLLV
jgi:translation elongation factor P/translation initiation factor 5A